MKHIIKLNIKNKVMKQLSDRHIKSVVYFVLMTDVSRGWIKTSLMTDNHTERRKVIKIIHSIKSPAWQSCTDFAQHDLSVWNPVTGCGCLAEHKTVSSPVAKRPNFVYLCLCVQPRLILASFISFLLSLFHIVTHNRSPPFLQSHLRTEDVS